MSIEHGTGCIQSSYDARDYVFSIASAIQIPDAYSVSISEIKDQGCVGSCVAHSVCEVLEAANKNEKYSTNWVYGYRPDGYYIGPGMSTRDACNTVLNVGYIEQSEFPGNTEMFKVKEAVDKNLDKLIQKAEKRKITAYSRLRSSREIKEAIYLNNLPVLIIVEVENSPELDDNFILQYNPEKISGCHCMVCYGWNELGLLVQNSWGEDWGNEGTFILPESYPIVESWAIYVPGEIALARKPRFWFFRKMVQSIIKLFRK